jgi:hypothetical protein
VFAASNARQTLYFRQEWLGKAFAVSPCVHRLTRSNVSGRGEALQGVCAMRGVITGREVLENLGLIYREFGAACLLRCLWAIVRGRSTTFLEVACQPEPDPFDRFR